MNENFDEFYQKKILYSLKYILHRSAKQFNELGQKWLHFPYN